MASELGVQTIQHTNGTDALTINSSGELTVSNKFPANAYSPGLQFIKNVSFSSSTSVDLTDVFSGDFTMYEMVFRIDDSGLDSFIDAYLQFLKTSDGSLESQSLHDAARFGKDSDGDDRGGGWNDQPKFLLTNSGYSNGGKITIVDPYESRRTWMHGKSYSSRTPDTDVMFQDMAGQLYTTTSYSGLRMTSDNATDGILAVYGWTGS